MKAFYFRYFLFFALILRGTFALAQVANDECDNATIISDPRNICINSNNTGATASNLQTGCFTGNGKDVWFSFRAVGLETTITLIGAGSLSTGQSLRNANVAFSSGSCSAIDERSCRQIDGSGFANLVIGGLLVGEIYRIRVWGDGNTVGTFQLCVKNYNPPATVEADCQTSAVLCDKSSFNVTKFSGPGLDPTELNDAPCLNGGNNVNAEEKSAWFRWTCQTAGTLTFKITPLYIGDSITTFGDDIDFAVYELTNGINSCQGKKFLRCMGSGPYSTRGCSGVDYIKRCQGGTGLRDGETDNSETGGCDCNENHSNFVAPIQMEAGKSYTIGINNFRSNVGQGFYMEFGGTGTFVGPQAKIGIDRPDKKYCLSETVIFTDNSSFALGQITKRQWRFGKNASIDTANGVGPFRVFYKTPGWKSVVLTITTDRGCIVTSILDSIFVKPFQYEILQRLAHLILPGISVELKDFYFVGLTADDGTTDIIGTEQFAVTLRCVNSSSRQSQV